MASPIFMFQDKKNNNRYFFIEETQDIVTQNVIIVGPYQEYVWVQEEVHFQLSIFAKKIDKIGIPELKQD